jgi:hypothetical protein
MALWRSIDGEMRYGMATRKTAHMNSSERPATAIQATVQKFAAAVAPNLQKSQKVSRDAPGVLLQRATEAKERLLDLV